MRGLIVSAFMLLGCIQAFGQESRKEVCIGFPVGNSTLDTAYGNNAARLSEVVSFLESVKKDSTLELVEVSFCGSASPEGGFAINRELAEKRRNSLERYVRERVSLPDGIISRPEGFIAWERLAELVEVSDMPHKEEAVDVLRNVPEFTYDNKGALVDSRKKHLMELQYGRTWHYMHKHFFDQIRNASVILVTVRQKPVIEEKTVVKEEPVVLPTRQPLWRKRTRSWRFPLKPPNLSTWLSRPTCSMMCWPFPISGWNFTWARTGQSVATGCTAGGKRTATTVTGASMAVTLPCATGSGRRPMKSRSPGII